MPVEAGIVVSERIAWVCTVMLMNYNDLQGNLARTLRYYTILS